MDAKSRAGAVAIGIVGLVALLVFLASGVLVLLVAVLAPKPGAELPLIAVKVVAVGAWAALFAWLLLDWVRLRIRLIVPVAIAWGWAIVLVQVAAVFGVIPTGS
jgi:hypothetical protein